MRVPCRSSGMTALLALAVGVGPALAQIPTPESVIGWPLGQDYTLADYTQISGYFRALDDASDRIRMVEIGETAYGRPMYLGVISSEENLEQLDRWKEISRRLAMGDATPEEARQLAAEGKAILWVDGGLHATEVAHGQMTPLLAHHLVTSEEEEIRVIRDETIVLLMPVMNPDGMDIVVDWYRRNLGSAFETAPLPVLYHRYVGHDNNRDWFMINQPETEAVTRQLWHEWYPQIVYNHHQTGPIPSRIFIPPFKDPMNPHIPPLVMRGINLVGSAMGLRFAQEEKPGAVSRVSYTVWWNGGMRTAPYFHNQVGILTETNLYEYATPHYYEPDELPTRFREGMSGVHPSVFYPDPWEGGWWRIGDAIDYMMTASMAVLDIGAELKEDWLYNMYLLATQATRAGEAGSPYAYVIPAEQWDAGAAAELVRVLRMGGIQVQRATRPFTAGGQRYPAGSYVLWASQPFRAHLMDLLEAQVYPDRRVYPGGPPDPPYDLSGWTLPLQMGVDVDRIDGAFQAATEPVTAMTVAAAPGEVRGTGEVYLLTPRRNDAFLAVNRLLGDGVSVSRAAAGFSAGDSRWLPGAWVIEAERDRLEPLARELGLTFVGAARPSVRLYPVEQPRVGLYKSWDANMDEGWTRWLMHRYGIATDTLHDADIQEGDLSGYHAIILPSQDAGTMLRGHPPGTMPEEFTGGLGTEGAAALQRFVRRGGTVLAFDEASDFVIEQFGLPVRNVLRGVREEDFFIPGSLIRATFDPADPIAWGMQDEAAVFFVESQAFEIVPPAAENTAEGRRSAERRVSVVGRYAEDDLLLSGWELGADRYLAGRPAVLRVPDGEGQVVLVAFRPQFRGQPHGTYKLVFNSLFAATVDALPVPVLTAPEAGSGGRPR